MERENREAKEGYNNGGWQKVTLEKSAFLVS